MIQSSNEINPKERILIVDDEENICAVLSHALTAKGYEVETASSCQLALDLFESKPFNLVLQDIKMPGMGGIELIRKYKGKKPSVMIIVITAFSNFPDEVEAMRLGVYDYLRKPFEDNDNVITTVRRALKAQELLCAFKEHKDNKPAFKPFIGDNEKIQAIYDIIHRVTGTDSTILIQGENGTGKELVARTLHYSSARAYGPFIPVNCGSFPEHLLESELFGHVKGSFTNAFYDKKGLIEAADNGTFFLDEVGEFSPAMQVKLLRVIEEREIKPIGSTETKRIDVRFIAATNSDLQEKVKSGEFREDLFYRLNVITITLPPLRERRDDIPLLAGHFLAKCNQTLKKSVTRFTPEALELLRNYDWPGNVRELENVIQRAVILTKNTFIGSSDLSLKSFGLTGRKDLINTFPEEGINLEEKTKDMEVDYILKALNKTNHNITEAANLLKMPARALRYKIKKYGIGKQ